MSDEPFAFDLPDALRAKLDAAGVTDEASLHAALEADPALAAEFTEFVQAQAANQLPPMEQALMAFVQAPDEAGAAALFARQRTLLQPYRAQEMLEQRFTSDDPDTLARLEERRAPGGADVPARRTRNR